MDGLDEGGSAERDGLSTSRRRRASTAVQNYSQYPILPDDEGELAEVIEDGDSEQSDFVPQETEGPKKKGKAVKEKSKKKDRRKSKGKEKEKEVNGKASKSKRRPRTQKSLPEPSNSQEHPESDAEPSSAKRPRPPRNWHHLPSSSSDTDASLSDVPLIDLPRPQKVYKSIKKHNRYYADLLEDSIQDVLTRNTTEFEPVPPSDIMGVHWSSEEKERFFDAVSLEGTGDLEKIAAWVRTKSVVECGSYLKALEDPLNAAILAANGETGRYQHLLYQGAKVLKLKDHPSAVEIPKAVNRALTKHAEFWERECTIQENEGQIAEFGLDWWILNEKNTRQKKKLEENVPEAQLLDPATMLELMRNIFLNNTHYNFDQILEDGLEPEWTVPAITREALQDFYDLAVTLTRRLVSTAMFMALNRQRHMPSRHATPSPDVLHADVLAACDQLNLPPSSLEYWKKLPRRLELKVVRKDWLRRFNAEEREELGIVDGVVPYEDVENVTTGKGGARKTVRRPGGLAAEINKKAYMKVKGRKGRLPKVKMVGEEAVEEEEQEGGEEEKEADDEQEQGEVEEEQEEESVEKEVQKEMERAQKALRPDTTRPGSSGSDISQPSLPDVSSPRPDLSDTSTPSSEGPPDSDASEHSNPTSRNPRNSDSSPNSNTDTASDSDSDLDSSDLDITPHLLSNPFSPAYISDPPRLPPQYTHNKWHNEHFLDAETQYLEALDAQRDRHHLKEILKNIHVPNYHLPERGALPKLRRSLKNSRKWTWGEQRPRYLREIEWGVWEERERVDKGAREAKRKLEEKKEEEANKKKRGAQGGGRPARKVKRVRVVEREEPDENDGEMAGDEDDDDEMVLGEDPDKQEGNGYGEDVVMETEMSF